MPARASASGETMYDQRLLNQTRGMDSGFADDEAYNVYDKPWREQGTLSQNLYRPTKNLDQDLYGDDLDKLVKTSKWVSFLLWFFDLWCCNQIMFAVIGLLLIKNLAVLLVPVLRVLVVDQCSLKKRRIPSASISFEWTSARPVVNGQPTRNVLFTRNKKSSFPRQYISFWNVVTSLFSLLIPNNAWINTAYKITK